MNEYKDLSDCLNKIESEWLSISNSSIEYNFTGRTLSKEFIERRIQNLDLINVIRKQSSLYKLEQHRQMRPGWDDFIPYYCFVDRKGLERFRVKKSRFSNESLIVSEISAFYNCDRIAKREDILAKNITQANLFIRDSEKYLKGLIYEDDYEAFTITITAIFPERRPYDIESLSFKSENIIELYCSHDKRQGYLKGTVYTKKIEIKIPEWEVISEIITNEEAYSLK
ncbi:MAG: hypothetical protein EOP45_16225 [Sphingobacteriaceae bacterium]|nr:MAG: hypothetical protein EOP45_16225 [Sphingobacteriaceae bacterium]